MDVQDAIRDLRALGSAHWFCPKVSSEDDNDYWIEDVNVKSPELTLAARQKAIDEFNKRKQLVIYGLQVFQYEEKPDTSTFISSFKQELSEKLYNCATCVRGYYHLRAELQNDLEMEHDMTEVALFMQKFDDFNNNRIISYLDYATNLLERLPAPDRKLKALDESCIFAFFEAMNSPVFANNEGLLTTYFDKPFGMILGQRRLKVQTYVSGMTAFLFSQSPIRREWAERMWQHVGGSRPPTMLEFESWIREPFLEATGRELPGVVDREFLPQYLSGLHLIISKVNEQVITEGIRASDPNALKLTLEHLHLVPESAFAHMMMTIARLFEIAPKAYWDTLLSMGGRPPMVIEQIFGSPPMAPLLTRSDSLEPYFSWVQPFIKSLAVESLPGSCRTLTHHFLEANRDTNNSKVSRDVCFDLALHSMNETAKQLVRNIAVDPASTEQLLEMFFQLAPQIFPVAKARSIASPSDVPLPLKLYQTIVELLTSLIIHAHRLLITKQQFNSYVLKVVTSERWKRLVEPVKPGSIGFAAAFLLGVRKLACIEPITLKRASLSKDQEDFNAMYHSACACVTQVLEVVNDSKIVDIVSFFKTPERSTGILSMLFCAETSVSIGATNILKTMNNDSSPDRRDAFLAMMKDHYEVAVRGFTLAIDKISLFRFFKFAASIVTMGMDIIDALCNSQDGILRARDLTATEGNATKLLWKALWSALIIAFDQTEYWSETTGHGADRFKEYCRDAIQFAGELFENHAVLVSALVEDDMDDEQRENTTKEILESPNHTMSHMLKWLRLRDEFLADKMVETTNALLGKLHRAKINITPEAVQLLTDVLTGVTRVKLGEGQMAALDEALEKLTGIKTLKEAKMLKEAKIIKAKKQANLSAYLKAKDNASDSDSSGFEKLDKSKVTIPIADRHKLVMPKKPAAATPFMKNAAADEFKKKRLAEKEAAKKAREALVAKQRKELNAAIDEQRLMAASDSSDSDSEDDDEMTEMEREIFGIPKKGKSGPSRPARSDLNLIDVVPKGPVKVKKTFRSARDMRARVVPDLSSLHRIVLGWDYFHNGDFPPNAMPSQYQKLASTFASLHDYQQKFEPLLFLEAWQGFVKSREENSSKPFQIKIANRSSVDSFFEISTQLASLEEAKREVGEGDIVLFSLSRTPTQSEDVENCLAKVTKVSRKKGSGWEVLYRTSQANKLVRNLIPGRELWAVKIHSLTTLEREYGALKGLPYYDLCDYIIQAEPAHLLNYSDNHLAPVISNYNLNKAQAKAVLSAIDNDAFTLIQGPPGSGKTKTIIAIVGALLTSTLNQRPPSTVPVGGTARPKPVATNKKLLVCAPSNAAVDELVMRLKQGVKTMNCEARNINVIRLGRSDAINAAVQDVTLEELVNAKLGNKAAQRERGQLDALFAEHKELSAKLNEARNKLETENSSAAKEEFEKLKSKKAAIGTQIDAHKDKEKNAVRTAELERKQVEQAIIDGAHVICATLSGSGHEMFQRLNNIEFETVIVDEAAQCVEASALIPLKYGCTKCILVGDPKQLPPTVLSKQATKFQYEQSLFVRMQTNHPQDIHLLDTQYRMHPDISAFPSSAFYDGRLLDGPDMAKLRIRPWHRAPLLGPYRFFNVQGQHETSAKGHSLINYAEIEVAMQLYERLTTDYGGIDFKNKIGVITPYKSQLSELKHKFANRFGKRILDMIEFNTTDAFQGRESEVIIFSCVRASPSGGIGFLQDIRRMNVGLTRAKSSLWVLGNADSLMRGEFWAKMIEDARLRRHFYSGSYINELRKPIPLELRLRPDEIDPIEKNGEEIHQRDFPNSAGALSPTLVIGSQKPIGATANKDLDVVMKDATSPGLDAAKIGNSRGIDTKTEKSTTISSSNKSIESTSLSGLAAPATAGPSTTDPPPAPGPKSTANGSGYASPAGDSTVIPGRAVGDGGSRPPVQIRRVKRPSGNPLLPAQRPKKPKPS